MSWQRIVLNAGLRLVEKPYLAREADPLKIRRSFAFKTRLLALPPRGTTLRRETLSHGERSVSALVTDADQDAPVLIYLHGGAYIFGSARTHAGMAARIAQLAGIEACIPDYRLAPEHPFPAAVEDARIAYEAVVRTGRRVILGGDSAGGGLALALLGDLVTEGAAMPAGVFAFSPLADMTFSGPSFRGNAESDVVMPASRDKDLVAFYLRDGDPAHPMASPLFADFTGAPPVYLTAGDTEIVLDDTRRMAERLRAQGVEVEEVIARDLPHAWPYFWRFLPEGAATLAEVAGWIRRRLGS